MPVFHRLWGKFGGFFFEWLLSVYKVEANPSDDCAGYAVTGKNKKISKKLLTSLLNCGIINFAVEQDSLRADKLMGNGVTVAPATLTRIA